MSVVATAILTDVFGAAAAKGIADFVQNFDFSKVCSFPSSISFDLRSAFHR